MKLRTIWLMRFTSFREKMYRTQEWAYIEIASKLPKRLTYWVTILEIGHATRRSHNVPATPLEQILRNLRGGPHVGK